MKESVLSMLTDVQLRKYLKFFLVNYYNHNPDYVIRNIFPGNTKLLDYIAYIYDESELVSKISGPLGRKISRLDIEYIFYIFDNIDFIVDSIDYNVELKKNLELIDTIELDRPKIDIATVNFETSTSVTIYETRQAKLSTYAPDEMDDTYLNGLTYEDEITPWEWLVIDRDEDNHDTYEENFDIYINR